MQLLHMTILATPLTPKPCLVLSCLVLSCCVVLCPVVSCCLCLVLSCLVMPCHALSCLVLSSNPTSCLVPLGDTSSLSKYWPWASTFTFHAPSCIPEWLSFVLEDKCWLEGWPQFCYTWRHHQSTCLNPIPKWYPFPETSLVNRHFSNHCTLALPHFVCGT